MRNIIVIVILCLLLSMGLGFDVELNYKHNLSVCALLISLFLLSGNKNIKLYFILPLLVLPVIYFTTGMVYGRLNNGILMSLFETNIRESLEFITVIPMLFIFLNILLLIVLILYVGYVEFKFNKRLIYVGLVLFVISPVGDFYKKVSPLSALKESETLKESLLIKPSWDITANHSKYDDYVLIIGESMRKDYMSAYGYALNTTPFLKKTNGFFLDGYLSTSPNTTTSLPRTLSISDFKNVEINNTIITLANKSGFDTTWISNQGFVGEFDTAISMVAQRSKNKFFLKLGGSKSRNINDAAILPIFAKELNKQTTKKRLFVLHLMGSHPNFCKRIKKDIYNLDNQQLSCYLSSYTATDNVIKNVINKLKERKRSYSLIYFSDHGLNESGTEQDSQLHIGNKHLSNYSIPFIRLSSDDTRRITVKNNVSAFHFLSIFSDWIGVKTKQIPDFDIAKKEKYVYVFDWNKMIEVNTLLLDPTIVVPIK
ncbi:sulfatase [Psychromonas sp. CNPT3]|uniref:phosphoethanolamine transferase n=1 Tax=Psychromonas sp. CNPT3 TaxID=314282 RepID=UPI00006E894C|nr:phosphoethanolamine transferase [Psychromonas sp. CNPT3]AGH81018.1 sulfatase [Psychromonas sp. CNPT3]